MTSRPQAPSVSKGWPVLERSILSNVLGLPGYAAIAIALGFTGLGVFIDLNRINGLGSIFKGCFFAGCLLAVCWVKRRALFGPLVAPPLLLALCVPAVVVLSGQYGASGSPGLADHVLSIGTPLLASFPTMAVTTAFVVAIGLVRYATQRVPQRAAPRGPRQRPRQPAGRRPANGGAPPRQRPPRRQPPPEGGAPAGGRQGAPPGRGGGNRPTGGGKPGRAAQTGGNPRAGGGAERGRRPERPAERGAPPERPVAGDQPPPAERRPAEARRRPERPPAERRSPEPR